MTYPENPLLSCTSTGYLSSVGADHPSLTSSLFIRRLSSSWLLSESQTSLRLGPCGHCPWLFCRLVGRVRPCFLVCHAPQLCHLPLQPKKRGAQTGGDRGSGLSLQWGGQTKKRVRLFSGSGTLLNKGLKYLMAKIPQKTHLKSPFSLFSAVRALHFRTISGR